MSHSADDPLEVLDRYLRASYARDFRSAYKYISAEDQRLKDETSYVRERGAFNGFTLEIARQLAAYIEVSSQVNRLSDDRAVVNVRLKVPDPNRLKVILLGWDSDRLDALSPTERSALIASLAKLRNEGKLEMIDAEESFEMIREAGTWKIFVNWPSRLRFSVQTAPSTAPLQVRVLESEVAISAGEPFNISLKVTNTSKHPVTARIGHLVDPHEFRDYLDLLECGFLLPIRLLPGKEEEFTSTYLLRTGLPDSVRQITVTYALVVQD
jgi:hypothetical protein